MIQKGVKQIIYISLLLTTIISCTYNNEEELYGNSPDDTCTVENVTYAVNVLPILQNNCYVCHKREFSTGGVNLEGYEQVKIYVTNGRLPGAIHHQPGFSPMPKGGAKLPACDIATIQSWIEAGAPNN
jgi:hypothetical protein